LMNVGLCMPQPGFLQGLRDVATKNGALLIFDEVKTGAKLAWGGASEFFGVTPDMICLAKSIGGGAPLGAFGASRAVMDLISQHKVFHGGTYNTNRISMAAGLATFREVLTRENYAHVGKLSRKLTEGYRKTVAEVGLQAYVVSAGVNGALMLYPQEIRNYRDWTAIDVDLWRHYWFAMVNRGVLPQPYWWDEQWTISVQHTEADIDKHLAVFDEIAPALAQAQQGQEDDSLSAAGGVEILAPQRGRKRELVAMAEENAALALQSHGYQVTVTELTGWEHSLKNELILGRRVHREHRGARAELEKLLQTTGVRPKLIRELSP